MLLGVTGVGATGAGNGVLVFDPADQAGTIVATDRTTNNAVECRPIDARRFKSDGIIDNEWTVDEPV